MLDRFYEFLDRIGYLHPIHPAMTHIPIGLVVGSLFIGATGVVFKRAAMLRSAYYTLVLALIFWVPTVIFGIMDWQRYYGGAWLFSIKMKLGLAGVLAVLLAVGAWLGYGDPTRARSLVPIYFLSFVTVVALGYFGGQLAYVGKSPAAPPEYQTGQKLYENRCSGCHAHGGNSIMSNFPVRGAPELDTFENFLSYLRHPTLPGGSVGPMPGFTQAVISDQQARELYAYINEVIEKPARQ